MRLRSCVVCLAALSLPATAQRLWVVDTNGGAGSHFRAIQPALDAAAHGDTVLVRPGQYAPVTTSKGVRLFGERGAFMFEWPSGPDLIRVSGLPPGETFVLKGFELTILNTFSSAALRLANCAGRVHVEGVRLAGVPYSNSGSPALHVENCAQVTVASSILTGKPALLCNGSSVALTHCQVHGQSAGVYENRLAWGSEAAVRATVSRLHLAWCAVLGGNGQALGGSARDGSPAAFLDACSVVASGDAGARVAAGAMPPGTAAASAIVGNGGDLLLDPTVPVLATGAAPPITGTIAVTQRRLLALRAAFAPSLVAAELFAQSGDPFALFGGMPGPQVQTPFGVLWLEPVSLFILASGVIDASQHRLVSLPVPPNPDLAGLPLGLVAARAIASTGRAELSNPMVTVLF